MIVLDRKSSTPLYEQIYKQIVREIVTGKLEAGSMLAPIRVLSMEINTSKNTIEAAYRQLVDEGYVSAKSGSGYYVNNVVRSYNVDHNVAMQNVQNIQDTQTHLNGSKKEEKRKMKYIFSAESVNSQEFEWRKWKKCMNEALYEEEYNFEGYKDCRGDESLRKSILRYIFGTRGVCCGIEQIVICSGTLYAVEKAAGTIKKFNSQKYKTVKYDDFVEDDIKGVFAGQGYKNDNICGDVIYVSPSHAYPFGHTMSMEEREKCINNAVKNNAFIIENDCDSEFTNGKEKLPSIQSLSHDDNVIYIGSMSRILSPNIRLAYMVLPKRLLSVYLDNHIGYRTVVPVLHQRTLAKYIDLGYMHKHIRRLVQTNYNKLEILMKYLKLLEEEGALKICGVCGGGYIAVKCDETEETLKEFAEKRGVSLVCDNGYYLIGYLSIKEEDVDEAAEVLYHIIKEYSVFPSILS